MLNIAFDIGGVLSKYPDKFRELINSLRGRCNLFCITDMHDREQVLKQLDENNMVIPVENVYTAQYDKHGEFCKAVLLKELKIDIFFDDFVGYTTWDSTLGDAPIRLLVQPDPFRPYWADEWKTETGEQFGRRKYKIKKIYKGYDDDDAPTKHCSQCGEELFFDYRDGFQDYCNCTNCGHDDGYEP